MAKRGRRTLYQGEDTILVVEHLARQGASNEQICEQLGIGVSTFYEWQQKFPELAEAAKKAKLPVDATVENALLKRALGYEYIEESQQVKSERQEVSEGKFEEVVVERRMTRTRKQMAPDVAAIIFWLRNRQAAHWRNRPDVTFEGQVTQRHEEHKHVVHELVADPGFLRAIQEATNGSPAAGAENRLSGYLADGADGGEAVD